MRDLLARCLADDQDAWDHIWVIVAASLRRPSLRRLLAGLGDGSLVDDAEQEFFLFLREDACRRLRVFRGGDESAFRGYIAAVARNFLISYRASRLRAEVREGRALPVAARAEIGGATEAQLLAVLREFLATLSEDDRRRLGTVLGPDTEGMGEGPLEIGTRTLRRWHRDLATIYRDRVL